MSNISKKTNYYSAWHLLSANIFLRRYWLFLLFFVFLAMVFFQDYRLVFFLILWLFLLVGLSNSMYFTLVFVNFFLVLYLFLNNDYILLRYAGNFLLTLFAGYILGNALFPAENKKTLLFLNQNKAYREIPAPDRGERGLPPLLYRLLLFLSVIFFFFFGLNGAAYYFERFKNLFGAV